jgi:hypothetical protein
VRVAAGVVDVVGSGTGVLDARVAASVTDG